MRIEWGGAGRVAGSMGLEAKIKLADGADKDSEAGGFSTLDLVKHAVRTIIHSLGERDRLSVVSYSAQANVLIELTPMNAAGKKKAEAVLDALEPDGMYVCMSVCLWWSGVIGWRSSIHCVGCLQVKPICGTAFTLVWR